MGFFDLNTVQDPTVNIPVQEAWFDGVRTLLQYLGTNKSRTRVYNSVNISITTSATPQALTFNSERYDFGSTHSTVSNTSRLVVPAGEGGLYAIFGHCEFAANATGVREIGIRVNGATYIARDRRNNTGAGDPTFISVYTQYQLADADYVELVAYQTSGGALNALTAGNESPEFGFTWLST